MLPMGEDKKKESWIDTQVEPAACGYVTAVDSSQKPALISMGKIIKILFNLIWWKAQLWQSVIMMRSQGSMLEKLAPAT